MKRNAPVTLGPPLSFELHIRNQICTALETRHKIESQQQYCP